MRAVTSIALLGCALCALGGCTGNRSALCTELEITYNDTIQRCAPGTPYQYFVFQDHPDVAACPYVNNTIDEAEITHQCLPWMIDVSCAEFGSYPGGFPDFCIPRDHFIFYHPGEFDPEPEL